MGKNLERARQLWVTMGVTRRLFGFGKWAVTIATTTAITTYVTIHVTHSVTQGLESDITSMSNQVQTAVNMYSCLSQQVQVLSNQQQMQQQKQIQTAVATAGIYFPTVTNTIYNTTNIIRKETIDVASLYSGWETEKIEAGDTNKLLNAKMTNGCTIAYLRLNHVPIHKTVSITAIHNGIEQSNSARTFLGNIVEAIWGPESKAKVSNVSYLVRYVRDPHELHTCSAFRIEDGFLMYETNKAWSVQWRRLQDNPNIVVRTVSKTIFSPQLYALYDMEDPRHVRCIYSDNVTGVSTQIVVAVP